MENILPIIIADAPEALTELCGVNLLERLLRILQRLGFRSAIVFSTTPEIIGAELAKRSWARQQITTQLVPTAAKPVTAQLGFGTRPDGALPNCPGKRLLRSRVCLPPCQPGTLRLFLWIPIRRSSSNTLIQNPSGPALVTRDFLLACSDSAPVVEELKQKIDDSRNRHRRRS